MDKNELDQIEQSKTAGEALMRFYAQARYAEETDDVILDRKGSLYKTCVGLAARIDGIMAVPYQRIIIEAHAVVFRSPGFELDIAVELQVSGFSKIIIRKTDNKLERVCRNTAEAASLFSDAIHGRKDIFNAPSD